MESVNLSMIAGVAGAQTIPSCPVTRTVTVRATILVSGTTFNGNCTRYVAGPELGDGSQSESQKPVFKVVNGTLRNVVLVHRPMRHLGDGRGDRAYRQPTTVRMTNTRYSRIGRQLFIGFASGNVSQSGNVQY